MTIDNFRVKHLNARIGFEELRKVIEDSENKSIEANNIQDVSAELLKILKSDSVAKAILPHQEYYYLALKEPFLEQAKTVHPGLKVLVEQACEVLGQKYRCALIDSLVQSIEVNDIEKTVQLTSLLASDLIHLGYDFRHLQSKGMAFVQKPTMPFKERLQDLFGHLRNNSVQKFAVAYRIDFANEEDASQCPHSIGAVQILSDSNADTCLKSQIPGRDVRLTKLSLEAFDHYAASRIGLTEFHRCLDVLQFARPSLQIISHNLAYVFAQQQQVQTVKTTLKLLGPIRIANEEVDKRLAQLTSIRKRIEEVSLRRLAIGLQYLRRGLTESAPQGQFLNYWIGLEAIAGGKHRSEMKTIRKTVSRVMALGYPRRFMRDLRDNFNRLRIALDPIATSGIELSGSLGRLEALWRSICDESLMEQLVGRAATSPFLQSRIKMTANMLGTSGKARESLLAHEHGTAGA